MPSYWESLTTSFLKTRGLFLKHVRNVFPAPNANSEKLVTERLDDYLRNV